MNPGTLGLEPLLLAPTLLTSQVPAERQTCFPPHQLLIWITEFLPQFLCSGPEMVTGAEPCHDPQHLARGAHC